MSTPVAIPSILVLIAAACFGLVFSFVGRENSNQPGAISRADRCRARPVFAEVQSASFVLDALIEVAKWLEAKLGRELEGQVYKAGSFSPSPIDAGPG